jgi:hypothetical protein
MAGLRAHEPDIAVDPVILGELRFGTLILPKGRKQPALERWSTRGAVDCTVFLGSGHGAEMGGTAGTSSHNPESHADQG